MFFHCVCNLNICECNVFVNKTRCRGSVKKMSLNLISAETLLSVLKQIAMSSCSHKIQIRFCLFVHRSVKFQHYASSESSSAKKLLASFAPFSPDLICSRISSAASCVYLFGCGMATSNGKPPRKSDCFKNIFTASEILIPRASKSFAHLSFVSGSVLICIIAVLIFQIYDDVMMLSRKRCKNILFIKNNKKELRYE